MSWNYQKNIVYNRKSWWKPRGHCVKGKLDNGKLTKAGWLFAIVLRKFIFDALRDSVPFVQFKNVKNTLQLYSHEANTTPWVFFTFFKLYKWYQIAQSVSSFIRNICFIILKSGLLDCISIDMCGVNINS